MSAWKSYILTSSSKTSTENGNSSEAASQNAEILSPRPQEQQPERQQSQELEDESSMDIVNSVATNDREQSEKVKSLNTEIVNV